MFSSSFLLSLKWPSCASQICLLDIVQRVSKLSPREPGAGGTPAEGEHKGEVVPKRASASSSSENSEENPYWEIFQSWLGVG